MEPVSGARHPPAPPAVSLFCNIMMNGLRSEDTQVKEQLGANQHLYASACFAGKEAIGILKVKNQRIEVAASASMTGMAAFMNSSHTILHMVEEATPVLTRTQLVTLPGVTKAHWMNAKEIAALILSLLLQGWEYLKCTNSQMADQKYHNNLCGSSTVVHLKLFRDCCQEAAIAVTKHCPSHADKVQNRC
ncbi:hypothetical protein PSHT_13782 [Puccinia striiformis]|uniref:Uncharacterized protein n=1 Tax=Puccinia striiformis TaxID=27350 RepID=A0A2S4UNU2_9BASI|nr:hypothetical protein PSHT_13782 [Puccinia striiformis]